MKHAANHFVNSDDELEQEQEFYFNGKNFTKAHKTGKDITRFKVKESFERKHHKTQKRKQSDFY